MFKQLSLAVALLFLLGACHTFSNQTDDDNSPHSLANKTTSSTHQDVHTIINGVRIGVSLPSDWQVDEYNGLVMAETIGSSDGMVMYLFIPEISDLPPPESEENENFALTVLRRVVTMPSHIGDEVALSQPVHLTWDSCDAAYYVLTSGDGTKSLVLGIEIPGENRLVVLNVSMPANQAHLIRARLPYLLNGLTINDTHLSGSALEHLPDPLPFPDYESVAGIVNSSYMISSK